MRIEPEKQQEIGPSMREMVERRSALSQPGNWNVMP